jgi:purine nucleosidase
LARAIILDADAGVDDALAIIFICHSPELELQAITAVSGNVDVDKTSANALKVLEALGISNVPVAKGARRPLLRDPEFSEHFHGKDGLGDSNLSSPRLRLDGRHATDLLVEEVAANPRRVTILATGPLTNIATAILRDPQFVENVQELVIMGGAYGVTPYGHGNVNPVAEFNIYVDPEAASIVFKSGIPLTAVGLDVTTDPKATLTEELYRKIQESQTPSAKTATLITQKLFSRDGFIHLNDPMAAAIVADPSLVTRKRYHVEIETVGNLTRGQTVTDRRTRPPESQRKPPNVNVCKSIDGERFLERFMNRILGI